MAAPGGAFCFAEEEEEEEEEDAEGEWAEREEVGAPPPEAYGQ